MRVLFVAESLSLHRNTGVASSVLSLARSLPSTVSVELIAPTAREDSEETETQLKGLITYLFPQPRTLPRTVVPELGQFLARRLSEFDLVHVHGLWRYPQWVATRQAQKLDIPYIISPHGMCEPFELARKAWKKKIYFNLVEKRNFQSAAAIHALTEAERDDCAQLQPYKKIEVIPHGVDIHPLLPEPLMDQYLPIEMAAIPPDAPVLLFMGRLHPKKGLDLLIPAFAQVLQHHPSAYLVLAGPDPLGYRDTLDKLAQSLNLQERVRFPGMVTGQHKRAMLQRADVFTLPSYSEGFSIAILEALAAAKPTVISKYCYFDEVVRAGCGQVVDTEIPQLAQALIDFLDLEPRKRASMGENGQKLIERKYTWAVAAAQMHRLYESVLQASVAVPRSVVQPR